MSVFTLNTATQISSAAGTAGTVSNVVRMTDTVMVYLYSNTGDSNRLYAVCGTVASNGSISFGTPQNISTLNNYGPYGAVCRMDDTHFMVAYKGTSAYGYVVCCSISGTDITVGTPVIFHDEDTPGNNMGIASLSSSLFVIAYANSVTRNRVIAGTISGTTITITKNTGTTVQDSYNNASTSICGTDSTHFVVSYRLGSGGVDGHIILAGSVSGVTITLGNEVGISGAWANNYSNIISLDSTHILTVSTDKLTCASLSGTTLTAGTSVDFSTGTVLGGKLCKIDDTNFGLLTYNNSSGSYRCRLGKGSVSGTTITYTSNSAEEIETAGDSPLGLAYGITNRMIAYWGAARTRSADWGGGPSAGGANKPSLLLMGIG
jgi:hypothetical protein